MKNIKDLEEILIKKRKPAFDLDYTLIKIEDHYDKIEKEMKVKYTQEYWEKIYDAPINSYTFNFQLVDLLNKLKKPVLFITDRPNTSKCKYLYDILKLVLNVSFKILFQNKNKYLNNFKYRKFIEYKIDFYLGDSDNDVRQLKKAKLQPWRLKRYHNNYSNGYNPDLENDIIFDIKF